MSTVEFSVLLPVYAGDRADYVERAYRSVTADQTVRPSDVVIVRDGPVDADLETLLASFERVGTVPTTVVRLARNGGLAHALTVGLGRCRHDVVARMDADDISLPTRFERQLPVIAGGADIVGSSIQEFMDEETPGLVRRSPTGASEIRRRARFVSPFNHPTVVYRRSVVEAAGGYEDLFLMEDYWLFARMIAAGAEPENLEDPLLLYRVGAGAYARRGGGGIFRSELRLQTKLLRIGFTTRRQWTRNVAIRGVYRLVPERLRRAAYRVFVRRRTAAQD